MPVKETISVALDPGLLAHARDRTGDADVKSLSAYINDALAARVLEERRASLAWKRRVEAAQADPEAVAKGARMRAHLDAQADA